MENKATNWFVHHKLNLLDLSYMFFGDETMVNLDRDAASTKYADKTALYTVRK